MPAEVAALGVLEGEGVLARSHVDQRADLPIALHPGGLRAFVVGLPIAGEGAGISLYPGAAVKRPAGTAVAGFGAGFEPAQGLTDDADEA